MASETRVGRTSKQKNIYVESSENDISAQGVFEHPGQFESKEDYFPSQNAYQQSNTRQSRFEALSRNYATMMQKRMERMRDDAPSRSEIDNQERSETLSTRKRDRE